MTLSDKKQAHCIQTIQTRISNLKPTAKKAEELSVEIAIGYMAAIDFGKTDSCIPPAWYVDIIRGEFYKNNIKK